MPFRRFWALVPIATSFTIAHSITLIASALGLAPNALWFPPLIETLIALSIVFMAFENIIGAKLQRRWMIAFGFGLIHGFGFSFALSESLQFAGAHLITSLLSFNVGVELGQLVVLALTVPVLDFLFRRWLPEVLGTIVLSAFLAHTGWHWMTERGAELIQYDFRVPVMDIAFAADSPPMDHVGSDHRRYGLDSQRRLRRAAERVRRRRGCVERRSGQGRSRPRLTGVLMAADLKHIQPMPKGS